MRVGIGGSGESGSMGGGVLFWDQDLNQDLKNQDLNEDQEE
jgi:hypothetical protein